MIHSTELHVTITIATRFQLDLDHNVRTPNTIGRLRAEEVDSTLSVVVLQRPGVPISFGEEHLKDLKDVIPSGGFLDHGSTKLLLEVYGSLSEVLQLDHCG